MGKASWVLVALLICGVIVIGVEADDTLILRPNGAGDETGIYYQTPASGYHWDKVDEETQDGDTTRVYPYNIGFERDLYAIPDHTSESGVISKVTIYGTFQTGSTTYAHGKHVLKTHGTVYETEKSLTGAYTLYSQEYTNNPYTGSAWTWDEVDSLQIGCAVEHRFTGGYHYLSYCTQVYAVVSYSNPVVAAFSSDTTEGPAPLTVAFTDSSTNTPSSWCWDIDNDGDCDYTTQNCEHTYTSAGLYTVNLTVNNTGSIDSEVKTDYITVSLPPTLSPHVKYTTFPTPPAGADEVASITTYPAEGVTCSKATLKCGIDAESEVWFEYGFTSGTYSYSTEHTSCSAGNQTETINGIPLTANTTVYYRAVTPYGYGEEMNFTTLELGATAFPTSTYNIYATQFFETEGNFTAMAELIWAPYIAKFGTLFFSILIGVIFLGLAAKQGSSFIPLLVIFIIGIPIFVMLAPEFLWLAQALIILGVGIAIYYFLTQPR